MSTTTSTTKLLVFPYVCNYMDHQSEAGVSWGYGRLSENDDLWKILSIDHCKTYYFSK